MIFRLIILVYCLLIVLGCSNIKHSTLVGTYSNVQSNYFKKVMLFIKNEGNIVGSKLCLEKDSTFYYTTCGAYNKGKWRVVNDSLILISYESKWWNDSLNRVRQPRGLEIIKFSIEWAHPIEFRKTFYYNKNKKVRDYLIKEDEKNVK